MTAQRPALADVLAVLTTESAASWWLCQCLAPPMRVTASGVEWTHATTGLYPLPRVWREGIVTPADALGALVEAALLPEHWADDGRAPRWWCERCRTCGGKGWIVTSTGDGSHGTLEQENCPDCEDGSGHAPAPPSHAALVAVASLGADTLARAEAIVAETWPVRARVWRVMTREALREHHEKMTVSGRGLPVVVSLEETQMAGLRRPVSYPRYSATLRWPVSYPRYSATRVSKDAARAWPALRALTALGLHLVALDDARVVLAVEALP